MGLDVAQVTMQWLNVPQGAAYEFVYDLVESSDSWGDGNAFGFYFKSHLLAAANEYIEEKGTDQIGQKQIADWIDSLPYDKEEYIALHFNW